ncbi:hypothetical protein [Rhodoferax sp.]
MEQLKAETAAIVAFRPAAAVCALVVEKNLPERWPGVAAVFKDFAIE